MSLESWSFSTSPFPDSLFNYSNNLSENEVLTNALLTSLSDSNAGFPIEIRPAPPHESATRNTLSGRVIKRKSRASMKSPTTYITADPANFRQMVQQVTGVQFGEPGRVFPAEGLLRPELLRGFGGGGGGERVGVDCLLPMLDTSAGLLDRVSDGFGSVESGLCFGFDEGLSFSTLESWVAM